MNSTRKHKVIISASVVRHDHQLHRHLADPSGARSPLTPANWSVFDCRLPVSFHLPLTAGTISQPSSARTPPHGPKTIRLGQPATGRSARVLTPPASHRHRPAPSDPRSDPRCHRSLPGSRPDPSSDCHAAARQRGRPSLAAARMVAPTWWTGSLRTPAADSRLCSRGSAPRSGPATDRVQVGVVGDLHRGSPSLFPKGENRYWRVVTQTVLRSHHYVRQQLSGRMLTLNAQRPPSTPTREVDSEPRQLPETAAYLTQRPDHYLCAGCR
jgi:hypothetical protein